MGRRQSRGEVAIAAQLAQMAPDSPRYNVLILAREFKASWVGLGEKLTEIKERQAYKAWGYSNFESYCRRELHLKMDTANKLTRSYAFLRDHEPHVLAEQDKSSIPALDVVDLLSQVHAKTNVGDGALRHIAEEAFSPQANVTRQTVMKKLREVDPTAFRPGATPAPAPLEQLPDAQSIPDEQQRAELRKALLLAERLESLLLGQGGPISKDALQHARQVVEVLRRKFHIDQVGGSAGAA